MEQIRTFNRFHLGDNLIHLQYLRRLAKANPGATFQHRCHQHYHPLLAPFVADLPQISFVELNDTPPAGEVDAWRGTEGRWYAHPMRNDFVAFHLDHFDILSRRLGLASPIKSAEDMLFDSMVLRPRSEYWPYAVDVLLIDSAPQSNQWSGYSEAGFDKLEWYLKEMKLSVARTETLRREGVPFEDICQLSNYARYVIGTAHGPLWPCFNIWAAKTIQRFVCFISNGEVVNVTPTTVCTDKIMDALDLL